MSNWNIDKLDETESISHFIDHVDLRGYSPSEISLMIISTITNINPETSHPEFLLKMKRVLTCWTDSIISLMK